MPDKDKTFSGSFVFGFENLMTSGAHTLLALCPAKIARSRGYGAYDTRGREGRLNTLGRIRCLTKSFLQ